MNYKFKSVPSLKVWMAMMFLGLLALGAQAQFLRFPQSGDVFRDYSRTMFGDEWRVTWPGSTNPEAWPYTNNPVIPLTVADLAGATRAELLMDFWGGHPGTQDKKFRFNGHNWIAIPDLATVPFGSIYYMQEVSHVVDVPLTDLVQGNNTLEATAGFQDFGWGQWGWRQVALRVYYNPATKAHPSGSITSPVNGNSFGENPTVTATTSAGVSQVDFFAYFDGYDPDGDGRYADWQVSFQRPLNNGNWTISEHVGSDTTSPFSAVWDTSLVPDQPLGGVKLVAHIRDANGYVFVTSEVTNLNLQRITNSVKIYRATGVPSSFWVRANQTNQCFFTIPGSDDLGSVLSAKLLIRSWSGLEFTTTTKVNSWVAPFYGQNLYYSYDKVTMPPSALLSGLNTFTITSTDIHHGTEIMWPGPALLVRYAITPDTTPPTPPPSFTVRPLSDSRVELTWAPSTDSSGVAFYRIRRAGSVLNTTPFTSYTDTGLTAATAYSYTVTAVDSLNNESSPSGPLVATTLSTSPVVTSGLALWLRGDAGVLTTNSEVSQWSDQSVNNRHAIQATAASRPTRQASGLNGLPTVRFDGLADNLGFTLPVNGLSGMTMFLVAARTQNQTFSHPASYAALFWNETAPWGTLYLAPFQTDVNFRFGTTQAGNSPSYPRPVSVGSSFTLSTALKNGATDSLYVNGVLALSQGGKLTTIAGCKDTASIGRGFDDNTYFAGDIAEVLVYNRALTVVEQQAVEQYLTTKYQIANQVPPQITLQPANTNVTEPAAANFSVAATGSVPLGYQWRRNGNAISAATNNSYTLSPTAQATDHNAQFSVVISNSLGSVTSVVATLTVNAPAPQAPSIGTQPANVTVTEPNAAGFVVAASGSAPLSYQWRRNGNAIGGATGSSYTLSPTTAATDSGVQFSVVVSNSVGSVTSVVATLTVSSPGSLPTNGLALWLRGDAGVVLNGSAVTQWNDNSGNNRNAIQSTAANQPLVRTSALNGLPVIRFDGANDFLTFTLPVNGLSGMTIFLVAANTQNQNGGSTQAEKAALFWNESASWGTIYLSPFQSSINLRFGTTQAGNQMVYNRPVSLGTNFSITTAVKNGSTDSLYVDGTLVLGQAGKLSTIAGCQPLGNIGRGYNDNTFLAGEIAEIVIYSRTLTAVERQAVEQTLSGKYGVGPLAAPQILSQPPNLTVVEPSQASFSVSVSGTPPLSYQWRRNGANIPGATGNIYTLSPTSQAADNNAQFSVVVTNGVGSVTSVVATLTVNGLPIIQTQPANLTVTAPNPATFTVISSGPGLSYQWRRSGVPIAGATSSSYTLNPTSLAADNGAQFSVVVSNFSGSVTSALATLTLNPPPIIQTQPSNQFVTAPGGATFTVAATGTGALSYQWRRGGVNIGAATTTVYTLTPTSVAVDNGAQFDVVVTDSFGSVTSIVATLTVSTPASPTISAQPASLSVIEPNPVSFRVVASGSAPLSYQWRRNGGPIGGATSNIYLINPSSRASDDGAQFTVVVSNSVGSITSVVATLSVAPLAGPQQPPVNWSYISSASGDLPVPPPSAGQSGLRIVDLDKNGEMDYVLTFWSGPAVIWYRHVGNTYVKYVIDPEALDLTHGERFEDVDGDGDLDLTFGEAFGDGVYWWENPYPNYDPNVPWVRRTIRHLGEHFYHDNIWGDFDGDGVDEFMAWNQYGTQLLLFEVPPDPRNAGIWPVSQIFSWTGEPLTYKGVDVSDINLDGKPDFVGGGGWFEHMGGTNFLHHQIDANVSYSQIKAGQIIAGGRPEVVCLLELQPGPLNMYEWTGGAWQMHTLVTNVPVGHTLQLGDINNDGHLDILFGELGQVSPTPENPGARLHILYGDGTGQFTEQIVYVGQGTLEGQLADIDGDGDLDIIGNSHLHNIPRIDMWINEGFSPLILPKGGTFNGQVTVSFSSQSGNGLYYTTNGNTPTSSSLLYTGPFTINANATVKAVSSQNGTVIGNPSSAVFTINSETVAPTLVAAEAAGQANRIRVLFSEPVTVASAENINNYAINSGIAVTSAVLDVNKKTVVLTTSPLTAGITYTLTVSGVLDRALPGNLIAPNSQRTFSLQNVSLQNLALWLKSDQGAVPSGSGLSRWNDQSGNGRDALQTFTPYSQPAVRESALNGRPVVRFDGVNDFLTFNLPINGLTGMSIFLVAANTVNQSASLSPVQHAAIFWNETQFWGGAYLSPFQLAVNGRFGTTQAGNNLVYNRAVSLGTDFTLTTAVKDGTTETILINGAQVLSLNDRLSTITACQDTGNLGRGYNDDTYFSGEIAEVLVYTRTLTVQERQGVEQYLAQKYQLADLAPPTIVQQPSSVAATQGTTINLSVTANGASPLSYRWRLGGVDIFGASTSSYQITNLQPAQAGNYNVVVSNPYGAITSAVATVTLAVPPAITQQPSSLLGSVGDTIPFSVTATGAAPLRYQWKLNNVAVNTATNSSYSVVNAQAAQAGNYTVVVTNSFGAVTSSVATLTLLGSGLPPSGLSLWLRADAGTVLSGSAVTQWSDQSGNNRHATQATAASRPVLVPGVVNGLPVVQFDGINDFLSFTLPVNGFGGMSIFLVSANTQNQGGGSSQAERAGVFWNETASWGSVYLSPFQSTISMRFGTTQAGNFVTYNRPSSIGSAFSLTESIKNGATDSLYVNGALVLSQGGKFTVIAGCRDTGNIGRGYNDNTFLVGNMAEVVVYNRALSPSERLAVEQYLGGKYGLATPSGTPPQIVSQPVNVVADQGSAAQFAVQAFGAAPLSYQWRRGAVAIAGATSASYVLNPVSLAADQGAQFSVVVSNSVGIATSSVATLTVSLPGWWNTQWRYRLPIVVNPGIYARVDKPVNVAVNFTQLLSQAGGSGAMNTDSIRVVEVSSSGAILEPAVAFQFDRSANYSAAANAQGTLVFVLAGSTDASTPRYFQVYFDTAAGFTAAAVATQVSIVDDVLHEGQMSYQIGTPRATYYYHKLGAGFASLDDTDGNDWIGYHPTGGAFGDFRSISMGDVAHPGFLNSTSSIVSQGPLKTTIQSQSTNGLWKILWEIYPTYATLTVQQAGAPYWLVYEGTPGGSFEPNSDYFTRSSGETLLCSQTWVGELSDPEWVFFGDGVLSRYIFLAHHEDDALTDTYTLLSSGMTVFGFGRGYPDATRFLTATNAHYTIGLGESAATAPATINAAYRDLNNTLGVGEGQSVAGQGAVTVTVIGSGSVTKNPSQVIYNSGQSVQLTAVPTAGWIFAGWSGALSGTANPANVTVAGNRAVTATFTNSIPTVPPQITTPPSNLTVSEPNSATFSVIASGGAPLSYQWSRNGVAIGGATASSFAVNPSSSALDNGAQFFVVVSNGGGSVTSVVATLTVNAPAPQAPIIQVPPANASVTEPNAASFSVVASGSAPLSYQWRRGGANLVGATTSSYTLNPTLRTADNNAQFSVVVTNSIGSVTSVVATLTVIGSGPQPPTIDTQPANLGVFEPSAANFSVAVSGSAPLTYQWRRNDVAIGGATSSTYTLNPTAVAADNGAQFKVVISNAVGVVTSAVATLTVLQPANIPANGLALWLRADAGTVLNGGTISQWTDQSGNNRHATQGTASARPLLINSAVNGLPSLRFDGANDFLNFTLPVNGKTNLSIFLISARTQNQNGAHEANNAALFWNETAGWGTLFLNPLQASVNLRFGTTQAGNSIQYSRPSSVGSSFTLTTAIKDNTVDTLYVNTVQVVSQSGKLPALAGCRDTASIGRGYDDDTFFGGDIAEVLVYDRALTGGERQLVDQYLNTKYSVVPTSPPQILAQPASVTVAEPSAATFSATVSGSLPLSYQWRREGIAIGAATNSSYVLNPTAASDNGAHFTLVISNAQGVVTSAVANLTVLGGGLGNGLAVWLRADGGIVLNGANVSQWSDQSGFSRHATQGGAASRPLLVASAVNGLPAVRFDGSDDYMTFPLAINGLPGMSIFLVAANNPDQSNPAIDPPQYGTVFWNETAPWGTVVVSSFQNAVKARFGTTQVGNNLVYTRPSSVGSSFTLTSALKEGTTDSLYVNGVRVLTKDSQLQAIAGCQSNGELGRGFAGYSGDIAEVMIYTRALSTTERRAVEAYLDSKYHLTTPLAPQIFTQSKTNVAIGGTYEYIASATGSPVPYFSLTQAPAGMTIDAASGRVSWTPSVANVGDHVVTVRATNTLGSSSQTFVLRARICPPNLIAYWSLDETTGMDFQDFFAVNNAVCVSPTCPLPQPGIVNGSQRFNGTTTAVSAPVHPSLDFGNQDSFSLEIWVKTDQSAEVAYIGRFDVMEYSIGQDAAGRPWFFIRDNDDQVINDLIAPSVPTFNNWHHVVGVRDVAAQQARLYVDGVLVNTRNTAGVFTGEFASPYATMDIGWLDFFPGYHLRGNLDEGALYGRALTSAEVVSHYTNGLAGVSICGTQISDTPQVLTQPPNVTVNAPASATFTVTAIGAAPLTYRWRREGVTIAGATSSSYVLTPTALTDNGAHFDVVVSNSFGVVTSLVATLTVNVAQPPLVQTPPGNVTVEEPAAASFGVTVTGSSPFSYQWRRGGVNIGGATSSTFVLNPTVRSTDNGALFSVVITNAYGSVTSAVATLTVNAAVPHAPSIQVPPVNISVIEPNPAVFSVSASGTAPLSYQWRRGGANIGGATSSSYTLTPSSQALDSGAQFSVVITNSLGSVTSVVATLSVSAPLVFTADGLEMWLRADAGTVFGSGSAVAQWTDQSGNNRHALQDSASNRPVVRSGALNGLPALRFDGVDDFLTFNLPINGLTGVTVFVVAANTQVQTGSHPGSYATLFWNETSSWGTMFISPFQSRINARFGTTQANNDLTYSRTGSIGTNFTITAAIKDGSTDSLYVNGLSVLSRAGRLTTIAGCRDTGNIARGFDDNSFYAGEIAEILVYRRALTVVERRAVELYLDSKYHLTTPQLPQIVTLPKTNAAAAQLYQYAVSAQGSPAPYFALGQGPTGMTIDAVSGVLNWTPSLADLGNFSVKVLATNSVGISTQAFTIRVWSCPPGLVAYWSLDETTGSVFQDFFDVNNASCLAPTCPVPAAGKVNSGQLFDSSASKISAPAEPSLDFDSQDSFTMEIWMNSAEPLLASFFGRIGSGINLALVQNTDGRPWFYLQENEGHAISDLIAPSVPTFNQWHHVVGVRNVAANQVYLYVDGVLVNSKNTAGLLTGSFSSSTASLDIGWLNFSTGYHFHGKLDEPALYRRALNANEIYNHYTNGLAGVSICGDQVNPFPQIVADPVNASVMQPAAATFNVVASGNAPLTYRWRRGGVPIAGANANSYVLSPTSVGADNGAQFDVVVSNSFGMVTSLVATLTVGLPQPPFVSVSPTNVTVAEPTAAAFAVTATGTAPLSYQWRRGGSAIAGATANNYALNPTTRSTDNGALFDVVVSNAYGMATSLVATLTVNLPAPLAPSISAQPSNATVNEPNPAVFSVGAAGTAPLRYQWRRGGANISGATNSTYTLLTTSQGGDSGAQFSVVVTNSLGSVTSSVAVLTVTAPLTVPATGLEVWLKADAGTVVGGGSTVSQWTDQSGHNRHGLQATAGNQPILRSSALNGLPALRFDGTDDFMTFTLPVNGLTGMTVFVIAANGQNQSAAHPASFATLFWNETAPWGTLFVGSFQSRVNVRFGTTQANNDLTYNRPSSVGTNFTMNTVLKDASTDSLFINGLQVLSQSGKVTTIAGCRDIANIARGFDDNTFFSGDIAEVLIYSRALGIVERRAVEAYLNGKYQLTPPTPPQILSQPTLNLAVDVAYQYAVSAQGTPPPYFALAQGPVGMTLDPITGVLNWTPGVSALGNNLVQILATNSLGVTTQSFVLRVWSAPPGLVAYWPLDETSGSVFQEFFGLDNASCSSPACPVPAVGMVNGSQLFDGSSAAITAPSHTAFDFANSDSFSFEAWVKTDQTGIASYLGRIGGGLNISLVQDGTGRPWFFLQDVEGHVVDTLIAPALPTLNQWHHVTGVRDAAAQQAYLYVDGALVNTKSTAGILTGSFSAAAAQINIGWLNFGTGFRLHGSVDEPAIYRRALTGNDVFNHYTNGLAGASICGASSSPFPQILTGPTSVSVTQPAGATFSVTASGAAPLSYQWRRGGVNIGGATATSFTLNPTSAGPDNNAQFTVVVSNGSGSVTSAVAILTVNLPPSIQTPPANLTVLAPAAANFSVVANGTPPFSYQWRRDGVTIGGATASSYSLNPTAQAADNGSTFAVVVSSSFGSVTSTVATLTVNAAPLIQNSPANLTITAPAAASFSVFATGTAPLSYQWRRGGVNIAGATGTSYTLNPTSQAADNGAQFSVVVTNIFGASTSAVATLTVNAPPSIQTQPSDLTVTAPASASFSVVASGTLPLSYQWRRGGANIGGATASSYVLNPTTVATDNGAQFSVVINNGFGSVTSAVATLTVTAGNVMPTNGLSMWLRADAGTVLNGATVSQWTDQSTNSRHATQASSSNQPLLRSAALNGLPVLRFDGVNDFLTFTLPVNGQNTMSIFLVGANTVSQSGGTTQAERAALFWNETAGWGTAYLTPFQTTVNMRFGTTQAGNQIIYNRPASVGTNFTLSTAIKDGTTDALYVNGSQVLSQNGKFPTIAGCRDIGNVGRGYNDNTFFAGDIAEVLIYNRALSASERAAVEQYLGTKYNLGFGGGGGGGGAVLETAGTELRAQYQDGAVLISWPLSCLDCVLQEMDSSSGAGVWSNVDAPIIVRENQHCVIVPSGSGQRFYRLLIK